MSDKPAERKRIRGVAGRSTTIYPRIFTDEWTGLPIEVKITCKHDSSVDLSAYVTGFLGLGTIPFSGKEYDVYTVETSYVNTHGERVPLGKGEFSLDAVSWMSVLSPLGLLPVPGVSELPRDYDYPFNTGKNHAKRAAKLEAYRAECLTEAVLETLRAADQAALADEYRMRCSHLQEITVDGRQLWVFLAPAFSSNKHSKADTFWGLIYQDIPKRSVKPLEKVLLAKRDESGAWYPVSSYLRMASRLTSLGVLLYDGAPSRIVVREMSEPPLEDFIVIPETNISDRNVVLRWSNGVLLEAKNRILRRVLQEEGRDGLLRLADDIEHAMLELNEKAKRAENQAQDIAAKGQGDPQDQREYAVLCCQRIEILKPMLTAIKEAAVAGSR